MAHAEVQDRCAVWPFAEPRESVVGGTVPRLRAEWRTADQAPGCAVAIAGTWLVRRREREMAVADSRPGGRVSRQVSGALVSHRARRNDRRRDEIHGEGRHAYEPEVVHRAGDAQRRQLQGA